VRVSVPRPARLPFTAATVHAQIVQIPTVQPCNIGNTHASANVFLS
jgi:hypothetical protein